MFGLQVELDPLWAQTKMWNDLRLCELEAMCVQMEKYSSSRQIPRISLPICASLSAACSFVLSVIFSVISQFIFLLPLRIQPVLLIHEKT